MDITAGRGDDGGEAATRGGAGDKGGGQGGRGNEDARAGAATGDQGGGVNNNKGVRMEAEFDEVITHLTTYLHILSSGSSDTDRDLKDQGCRVLNLIQSCYNILGNLGELRECEEMETELRKFLSGSFNVENDRSQAESADVFSHLEIKSLMLLRRIKKLNRSKIIDEPEGSQALKDDKEKVKRVKVKFINPKKLIPKKAYKCPHCEFSSASMNVKSLQNHIKDLHPALAQVSENDFTEDSQETRNNKIECLLRKKNGQKCGQFFTSDQLKRHLRAKKLHNIVPEIPKGQEFKGWRMIGEKVEIVCGLPSDEDPPSEEEIDIQIEVGENEPTLSQGSTAGKKRKVIKEDEAAASSCSNPDTMPAPSTKNAGSLDREAKIPKLVSSEPLGLDQGLTSADPNLNVNHLGESEDLSGDVTSYLQIQEEVPKTMFQSHDIDEVLEGTGKGLEGVSFQLIPNSQNSANITIVNITPDHHADSLSVQDKFLSSAAIESGETSLEVTADNMDFAYQSDTAAAIDDNQNHPSESVLLNSIDPRLVLEEYGTTKKDDELETNPNNNNSPSLGGLDNQNEVVSQEEEESFPPINDDDLKLVLSAHESLTREELQATIFANVTDQVLNIDPCPRKPILVKLFNPKMKGGEMWSKEESPQKDDFKIDDTSNDGEEPEEEDEEEEEDDDGSTESEEDSDFYDENLDTTPAITRMRHERRKVRWSQREGAKKESNLTEIPGNASFIDNFMSWLTEKTSLKTTNKDCSTLDLSMGHGFEYVDSYLNFMSSKTPGFTLSRLVAFKDKAKFLAIESPVMWISTAAGPDKTSNPSRQKQQLNFHKRLRDYILFVLNRTTFDGNDMLQSLVVNQRLQSIEQELVSLQLGKKCDALYKKEQAKTKKMKMIVNPSCNQLEYSCVRKWFNSEDSKQLEAEARDIHKEAMKSESIKAFPFSKVGNLARFTLAIKDKNRPSSYRFSQMDYMAKKPIWLPGGDSDNHLWSLDNLPDDWDMFKAPDGDVPPTCFVITLDGSQPEIKMQAETTIIMDMKTFELVELYRDLRTLALGDLPSESTFFVNNKGKPLSRLQNSKGSLVERFGKVVGIPNFRMTQVRKALEGKIQGSNQADHTKAINNHSKAVVPTYDNANSMRRTLFMASMSASEAGEAADTESVKNHYNFRRRKDQSEQDKMMSEASKYLDEKKRKGKKILNLAPSPISKTDAMFLNGLFTKEDVEGEQFKKLFYWNVDAMSPPDGSRLRKMEADVFQSKKAEIMKELNKRKWNGSVEMNRLADIRVSEVVKRSINEIE